MINQMTNSDKKTTLIIAWAIMIALFGGCASYEAPDVRPPATKRITDLIISENSESLIITIKGNQSLTYETTKQVSPIGVRFQFPDTSLDIFKRVYIPPDNEIIRSITAEEIVEDQITIARIIIGLKKDTPYDLSPNEAGLKVVFPKAAALSKDTEPQKELAKKKPATQPVQIGVPAATPLKKDTKAQKEFVKKKLTPKPIQKGVPTATPLKKDAKAQIELPKKKPTPKPIQKGVPAATQLKTVTATPLKSNVVVSVKADGAIKDFKSFAVDNPARIVIEMYNIKSPYEKEQIIAVESQWVKRIRYFGYPDKVRLVLDTHKEYLAKYSALSVDTGLLIHIGDISAASDKARQAILDDGPGTRQITLAWDDVPNASSYNIYWSTTPGVTKRNGNKISNVKNPATIKGLKPKVTYYFVVTSVRESQESKESEEFSYTVGE